jgi:hypothetical protein
MGMTPNTNSMVNLQKKYTKNVEDNDTNHISLYIERCYTSISYLFFTYLFCKYIIESVWSLVNFTWFHIFNDKFTIYFLFKDKQK